MQNPNQPLGGLADLMAMKGRYGDTELVHMSKPEVAVLNSTGKLTVNPDTGLPEAFNLSMQSVLPIALGIAGSILLPGIGGALGSGIGAAMAGSALGTAAGSLVTGKSLEDSLKSAAISGALTGVGGAIGGGSFSGAEEAAAQAAQAGVAGGTAAETAAITSEVGNLAAQDFGGSLPNAMGAIDAGTTSLSPTALKYIDAQKAVGIADATKAATSGFGPTQTFNPDVRGVAGNLSTYVPGALALATTPEDMAPVKEFERTPPQFKNYTMSGGEVNYAPDEQTALDIALGRQPRTQQLNPYSFAEAAQGGSLNRYNVGGTVDEGQVAGVGDGMSDNVVYRVEGGKPDLAMLSRDEYILPADVVAMLGNGSSNAGSDKIDSFVKSIRKKSFGTDKQQRKIDNSRGLSALAH